MNALTLQWHDASQNKTQNIYEQQPSQNPGTVRIGRDPVRCDIVLSHPTVSGLHIEIFFHHQQQRFYIRNLRSQNPPLVNGSPLVQGEMPLTEGNSISLGQIKLNVISISTASIPTAILLPPHPPTSPGVYSLQCPKCHKVSPGENLYIGCRWCGTSLAAAVSVIVVGN